MATTWWNDRLRTYYVEMSAGLSYHVWLASRIFETDYDFLPWLKSIKIRDKNLRKDGRKRLIADFAYYLCSYAIILHELSHIYLGHTDFLRSKNSSEALNEFPDENEIAKKYLMVRYAFEAEADRQSVEFLMAFLEGALGNDGMGSHIRFPNRLAVYEFVVYALTSLSALLQQMSLGAKGSVHPDANARQYIFYSSIVAYLKKRHPDLNNVLETKIPIWAMEAGKKMGILNSHDPFDVMRTALELAKVDDILKESGVRGFQHKMYTSEGMDS
ncbi:hypothetical protein FT643_17990 [Ketobacter sp. MCCC 1A13808]|uniref:hypothetical protein n=1 Tax=Ketobacter sp. MCCC 1A13808 TaxID=2602738 RepID=UPI0012EC4157|nr:hypothetical protein [Ketobacter sp. MCCC 1A13808]MVF14032.1 hypothetical protein [Ketobacter sp. MCCC 1A13808]